MAPPAWVLKLWTELQQNHLWQRLLKHTIAVTLAFTIVVIPAVGRVYGPSTYLAPMTTVFGHSGRRLGQMVESLVFILAGAILGTSWSILGLYLSSLVYSGTHPRHIRLEQYSSYSPSCSTVTYAPIALAFSYLSSSSLQRAFSPDGQPKT